MVFVTGKGGVGKTVVASLMAAKTSLEGKKTLLVEMGSWSYLEKALELPFKVGFQPQKTPFGFDVARWSGEDCLRDYIQYLVKVPWVSETFLKNSWLRALIQVAPGLKEIAFLGKVTSGLRAHGPPLDYDCIIVDAVSSGHFVSLLKTPAGLAAVAPRGPMRAQCESIQAILNSVQSTRVMIVTNLEAYSVQESFELAGQVRAVIQAPLHFVANQIYPIPPSVPQLNEPLNEELQKFLAAQWELGSFQQNQIRKFSESGFPVHRVWFYFDKLKNILRDGDEVVRLF